MFVSLRRLPTTTCWGSAEDRAQRASEDRTPEAGADRARGAFGRRLDQSVVLATARARRAEQDVRQRVGNGGPCRGRRSPRLSSLSYPS